MATRRTKGESYWPIRIMVHSSLSGKSAKRVCTFEIRQSILFETTLPKMVDARIKSGHGIAGVRVALRVILDRLIDIATREAHHDAHLTYALRAVLAGAC
jgi:hypothetical protein